MDRVHISLAIVLLGFMVENALFEPFLCAGLIARADLRMIFDLHSHSTASDGALSPEALLARANANGVSRLALTDHDTVAGVKVLQAALADPAFVAELSSPIELVPGVEISAEIDGRAYHILGLWLDTDNEILNAFLDGQRLAREERAEAIGAKLAKQGIEGALAGAKALAGDAVLSRPHFARFLLEQGHCTKEQQAYKRWLGAGKSCDVPSKWPSGDEAIATIHAAGGLAVLAHPDKYGLTRTRMRTLLEAFKAAGGDGLELISGRQDDAITDYLLRLSHKYDLACSTGSDFHNPEQVWADVGCNAALPSTAVPIWSLAANAL